VSGVLPVGICLVSVNVS